MESQDVSLTLTRQHWIVRIHPIDADDDSFLVRGADCIQGDLDVYEKDDQPAATWQPINALTLWDPLWYGRLTQEWNTWCRWRSSCVLAHEASDSILATKLLALQLMSVQGNDVNGDQEAVRIGVYSSMWNIGRVFKAIAADVKWWTRWELLPVSTGCMVWWQMREERGGKEQAGCKEWSPTAEI